MLYVGKATSLRDRVRSYFSRDLADARSPLIVKMIEEATAVDFVEAGSVLEALILEARLIKKHKPPYNTEGKDDKTWNHVVITDEDYPRVFTMREKNLQPTRLRQGFGGQATYNLQASYGPFTNTGQLKEALKIIRKIFPFRGEKDLVEPKQHRSLLNRELGLVPDFTKISKEEYVRTIRHLKLFFEGKKKQLLQHLEREMKAHAKKLEFEKAEVVKRQLFALKHIHDVSLIKPETYNLQPTTLPRIEAYDVAHISGTARVGVMTVVENSESAKGWYRKFKIQNPKGGDTGALQEILRRRFGHEEWSLPKLIVVDGGKAQLNAAEVVLREFGYEIPIVAVVKNERHRPRQILGALAHARTHEHAILLANSEAHRCALSYHQSLREKVGSDDRKRSRLEKRTLRGKMHGE